MRCLCLPSYPPLPTIDILCCVLCCAYAYAKLCVCVCGTTHTPQAYACVKCVGFYECMCITPPTQLWCALHAKHA